MGELRITKSSGTQTLFDAERIRSSVLRVGVSPTEAERILGDVHARVRPGMSTQEIFAFVQEALARHNHGAADRYRLREALFRLGPSGFHFEQYIAALLQAMGYQSSLPEEYQGACVMHEVDVEASKGGRHFAIEAKFRNSVRDLVHLKDVMASYARYIDLLDGAALGHCPRFDEFWILTNNQFTDRGMQFGRCKGLRLIGWKYPKGQGLAYWIDSLQLYPVTVLHDMTERELAACAQANIMLCRDLCTRDVDEVARRTGLSRSRVEELAERAGHVMQQKVAV